MPAVRPFEEMPLVVAPENYALILPTFLASQYEKYGPIFRLESYETQKVIMIGPEANRFVLSSNRLKFSHKLGWGEMFGMIGMFGDGLLTMDGAEHDEHRRMMNPAFTIQYMDRYLPIMTRVIRQRVSEWIQRGNVDIFDEARRITFDVAAEALTGLQPGPEIDEFRKLYVGMLMLNAETQEEWDAKFIPIQTRLYQLLTTKIRERREHPTNDILGMMVQARDDDGNALSDQQLIAHVNILLIAGHETSTSLVSWLLYLLEQNPDYRQRCLDEQAALLRPGEEPTLDAIKQMKVLDNALSEAERLYPPVPNGPRGVLEDFEFGGYHVPAGTHVFYSIAASHVIPSVFRNPTQFDPDRFAAPRSEDKTPYALVGFGGGPRICIGINFAQVEIKAMVSHILRYATLKLVPDQEITQVYGATGMPLNGIKMQITAREPQPVRP